MKLHVLIRSLEDAKPKLSYRLLEQACKASHTDLIPVELEKMSIDEKTIKMVNDGDAWLRLATGKNAEFVEQAIARPELSTIYEDWRYPLLGSQLWNDTILMLKAGLPIIDTTFLFTQLEQNQIDEIVEKLGGYPIVLKYTGLSHGQGVFLCADIHELKNVINKFPADEHVNLALRKFIPEATHIRAVVVGDKVADTIEYDKPADDFRTNAAKVPTAKSVDPGEEVAELVRQAARVNGIRFAGVDILLDKNNRPWIAEVNTPCNYARNYLTNGKNLAIDLVEILTAHH